MNTSTLSESASQKMSALAGKYLTFQLGREIYGITVIKVREIIRLTNITPVPQMPDHIKGVINLRGRVIPVVDLRVRFQLDMLGTGERTCIVVVQVTKHAGNTTLMGLVVDGVEEVANIVAEDIEPTPEFGGNFDTSCILGMAKIKGVVKTLLDIERVLLTENTIHPA